MFGNGRKKKKSVGWIIKSCARRSLGHINSHRNMSVIEKWGGNEKETSQGSRSFRSPPGLTGGKEGRRKPTNIWLCAGGRASMSLLVEKMEGKR